MDVFGVQKRDQLALIRDQIVRCLTHIESGELTPTQEKGYGNLLLKAVHQMSELTGRLPQRMAVELEAGGTMTYELIGLDGVIEGWEKGNELSPHSSAPVPARSHAAVRVSRKVPPEHMGKAAREESAEDDPGEPVFR